MAVGDPNGCTNAKLNSPLLFASEGVSYVCRMCMSKAIVKSQKRPRQTLQKRLLYSLTQPISHEKTTMSQKTSNPGNQHSFAEFGEEYSEPPIATFHAQFRKLEICNRCRGSILNISGTMEKGMIIHHHQGKTRVQG